MMDTHAKVKKNTLQFLNNFFDLNKLFKSIKKIIYLRLKKGRALIAKKTTFKSHVHLFLTLLSFKDSKTETHLELITFFRNN